MYTMRPHTSSRALAVLMFLLALVALSAADESVPMQQQNPSPADNSGQAEDIDLDVMSDEELEEICTSRGFELVREMDATTGEPLVYTHQDYVDAASECLQIEADLEEILTNHPEILEDVRKESERMMKERDRLQQQLDQLKEDGAAETENESGTAASPWGLRGKVEDEITNTTSESDETRQQKPQSSDSKVSSSEEMAPKPPEPIFDFKEITQEVIKQMKADATRLLNIIFPKPLRDQLLPSLKTFGLVAKDMCISTYDLLKRYLGTFLDRGDSGNPIKKEKEAKEKEGDTQQ